MTFALPDDLIVEVRRPERAVLTVAEILARPSAVRGTWDGPEPAAEPQEPGITFRPSPATAARSVTCS
jgi:hypothetical protein